MPFVFVQIRPVGDKRGSWYVQRSDSRHHSTFRDLAGAQICVRTREGTRPLLVIQYNHLDRPAEAWAVKKGQWRRLQLITG